MSERRATIVGGWLAGREAARRASRRGLAALSGALCLGLPAVAAPQRFSGFDDFLKRYGGAAAEARAPLAQAFVSRQQARGGFPIVQPDGTVVFLYQGKGDEKDVRLLGDFRLEGARSIYWDPRGEPLSPVVSGGGVFYRRMKFETDARIEYRFKVDGEDRTDPLNARVADSGAASRAGLERVSVLVMPKHRTHPETAPRPGVARGTLRTLEEAWAKPGVTVYLPPRYDEEERYPVIYTADGSAWIDLIGLPAILDNLIADRAIIPVIAVMIDAAEDRARWYSYNPDYLAYLEKVVAYVDQRYSTWDGPGDRLLIGTSAGGRAALYAGLERPRLFRNLAALSPGLGGPPHDLEPYFSGTRKAPADLRIWMSAGTYEPSIESDVRTLEEYFRKAGVTARGVYTRDGHTFGAWRDRAVEALRYFYPAR